jgi:formamidopyrimidine-DNA glycosylase
MPELPEVETTVRDLKKTQPPILGAGFINVWTDVPKILKLPKSFEQFKKEIKGKKIQKIWRRGKNILFELSDGKTLLIHQKLTGHLLLGKWEKEKGKWRAETPGPLTEDPINRFLHLVFWLDNDQMLALSDLRKFAKVELSDKENLEKEISSLGPEPLEKDFTFEKFKEAISKKNKGKVKQVLMDQNVIAGIGNIYSDEILWQAKIHPFKEIKRLSDEDLKKIYRAKREILARAIRVGGESISDFRRISGEKGGFDPLRNVYRREGEKCSRCGSIIKKIKLAGRSAHFCPHCQRL